MIAGYELADGKRLDVASDKGLRRVRVEVSETAHPETVTAEFCCTPSEARAIASAFMGAAAEL